MAPDAASGRRSASPETSGRDSPIPRQWRNQQGGEEHLLKDKTFRKYAAVVDKALALFETALDEWADYISFLNRLLKALQSRPSTVSTIPSRVLVAKRLAQCLDPTLPSGVHQKALEVYSYVFQVIGTDGLSRDLPLYLPGLASVLSFASLSVRSPYLDILERRFLGLDPKTLRPAMKSIILALLPGLEDETAEDFDRTMKLVARFKEAIRPPDSELLTNDHATGDDYFWQCFFLASITSHGRRPGALAYLTRYLPSQGPPATKEGGEASSPSGGPGDRVSAVVTSPEPGLLVRCFASGLSDDQLLIQRGFLDLLVTHLPLSSKVLRSKVKADDLQLLLKAAVGVVTRRDMSLNRRLWVWLLGPEPAGGDHDHNPESPATASNPQQTYFNSKTSYFEEFTLQPLTSTLLAMIRQSTQTNPTERARPYRICLSLMDIWEVSGLIIPEVFLPMVENVREFKEQASSKAAFAEVLRSASFFFNGIESGIIYGELVGQLAKALSPSSLSTDERLDKLSLVDFVLANFNVREEEMVTTHAPLSCLAALCMLQDLRARRKSSGLSDVVSEKALSVVISLLELVPGRAFPSDPSLAQVIKGKEHNDTLSLSSADVLEQIQHFYVQAQGNVEAMPPPLGTQETGELLLRKCVQLICDDAPHAELVVRILTLCLTKVPSFYALDTETLMSHLQSLLGQSSSLTFASFTSIVELSTELHAAERIETEALSQVATQLVKYAWSFLSASKPKYHVETVRSLWHLQTALSLSSRDIEASLSSLIAASTGDETDVSAQVDRGHRFTVLWSHTLQDNPSDRRVPKTPGLENRSVTRLPGMDYFEVMLTRPLFLILDALLDERTQEFMAVKSWLQNMIGIDRLFLIFVHKLCEIDFLQDIRQDANPDLTNTQPAALTEDDDLDLCLYYLQTFSNVLKHSGEVSKTVLATKHVSIKGQHIQISSGGEEEDPTLQDFFIRVCVRCITGDASASSNEHVRDRVSKLHRFALGTLHQFYLSRHAASLPGPELENILFDRLGKAIDSSDSYVQVLLLDVILSTLKLREATVTEHLPPPPLEKRSTGLDAPRTSRPSIAVSDSQPQSQPPPPPPPQLLKCLQAALASQGSRPVLDSWISFLTESLPFYAESIFQVLIPLVETLCAQIGATFSSLRHTFLSGSTDTREDSAAPESTLIYLLNGLEQVLARSHDQLLAEEARAQLLKGPDQPQSIFGSMVSGVFQSDGRHTRSATANDRLTVHLAFQDATRMCYRIWSWGLGEEASQQDPSSASSFNYTCLRMRNRARRLLEHLFTAETLECLETVIDIWKSSGTSAGKSEVFNLLSALEASRPRHTVPALFNSIYSRTNPAALDPSRKSTMTISVEDSDLVVFLVEYARSLDDDAMDEIWQDCIVFLKDLLGNPFPHRQNLTNLLEFTAILGEKVDNTNFGEQRKMRRELGDLFLRLLTALFTTRPISFSESSLNGASEKASDRRTTSTSGSEGPEEVVASLSLIVPTLPKVLVETDRVLSAATSISTNVIVPTIKSKNFPDSVSQHTLRLLHELSRLQNNQKTWKKDVGEALNDTRFFGMNVDLVEEGWLPLLKQWINTDKDRLAEIVNRITAPTTAGIVFGVGATSARLEADRKTQINLRRIATLVLAAADDAFVTDLPGIVAKLVELLSATATSSPSSATRGDVYMVIRTLVLKMSPVHLAMLWPVVNAELHTAISSAAAADNSTVADTYGNAAVLQACKLLDLLICVAPDDFQLHEWLFITDTIDAVHRYSGSQPVALVDELSEELGSSTIMTESTAAQMIANSSHRRPLLGPGGLGDGVNTEVRRDELVAKVLRPFFGQLSIFAFESTYAMTALDRRHCVQGVLKDLFDERSIARAL